MASLSTMPAEFAAGAIFGSALVASGVSSPSVIVSQMQLENFHMLKSYLVASGCSALLVTLADYQSYAPCRLRAPADYGWFLYDANVLGGLMIGAGMTLTGACPGTVMAQIGTGIRSGVCVGLGGLAGGVLYTGFAQHLPRAQRGRKSRETSVSQPAPTIQSTLKTSTSKVLISYEVLLLATTILTQFLAPQMPYWLDPVVGGAVIGAAQAATVLLTRRTVGVSTAFQDLGRFSWKLVLQGKRYPAAALITPAVTFASGIVFGAALLARSNLVPRMHTPFSLVDASRAGTIQGAIRVNDVSAVVGGAVMVFGAGLAAGCPCGHGISGMATFSVASFVSVAAMFAGGIAVARVFLPQTPI